VFAEMERLDIIDGETPPAQGSNITVLNADERCLPTLLDLHKRIH